MSGVWIVDVRDLKGSGANVDSALSMYGNPNGTNLSASISRPAGVQWRRRPDETIGTTDLSKRDQAE
jgi:hypothetical protein